MRIRAQIDCVIFHFDGQRQCVCVHQGPAWDRISRCGDGIGPRDCFGKVEFPNPQREFSCYCYLYAEEWRRYKNLQELVEWDSTRGGCESSE